MSGLPQRPGRAAVPPEGRRHGYSAHVLLTLSWLIRAATFVAVGVDTFTSGSPGALTLAAIVAGYAVSGLALSAWALIDMRGGPGRVHPLWMPVLFGVIAAVSGAASALPSGGSLVALTIIAVIGAGTEAALVTGWAVTGVGILATEVGVLLSGADSGTAYGYPLFLVIALLAGHNRRAYVVQAEQARAMLAQVEQLRSEQRRVAVLDERTRIAREIHDVLAHSLGALGIQIQAARAVLTDQQDIDRAVDILGRAQRMAADGLTDTRRAVHALRTDIPSLDQALAAAAETHRRTHGATVDLTVDGTPVPLPAEQTVSLLRTAQESLTNAAKHAPDQPVDLIVRYQDDSVTLTVTNPLDDGAADRPDDGSRFATVDGGYGLTGMRERLLLLGGTLTAAAEDGRWTVTARAPR